METTTTATNVHAIPQAAPSAELPISPNAMAALSNVFGIVAVVALVMRDYQKDPHVRFSAIQALLFQGTWIGGYIVLAIGMSIVSHLLTAVLGALNLYALLGILVAIPSILGLVGTLGMFVVAITLVVTAAQGKTMKLPILGAYALRFATR